MTKTKISALILASFATSAFAQVNPFSNPIYEAPATKVVMEEKEPKSEQKIVKEPKKIEISNITSIEGTEVKQEKVKPKSTVKSQKPKSKIKAKTPVKKAKEETKPENLEEMRSLTMSKFPAPLMPKVSPGEILVSNSEINIISFNTPVKQMIFPTEAEDRLLSRAPIYMNSNKDVGLQFKKGVNDAIQSIIELEDGSVKTLYFKPLAIKGVMHKVKGPEVPAMNAENGITRYGKTGNDTQKSIVAGEVDIYKAIMAGTTPSGFDEIRSYPSIKYDRFTVNSLKSYAGQGKKVHVFKVVARDGLSSTVSAPMFNRKGVTSIMVDGDRVDANYSPIVIVVEDDVE